MKALRARLAAVNAALAAAGAEVQEMASPAAVQDHELLAWVEHQEGRLAEFIGTELLEQWKREAERRTCAVVPTEDEGPESAGLPAPARPDTRSA